MLEFSWDAYLTGKYEVFFKHLKVVKLQKNKQGYPFAGVFENNQMVSYFTKDALSLRPKPKNMNLTKSQIEKIEQLKKLSGLNLIQTKKIKRNIIAVEIIGERVAFISKMEALCNKYNLGKVSLNGISEIAITF